MSFVRKKLLIGAKARSKERRQVYQICHALMVELTGGDVLSWREGFVAYYIALIFAYFSRCFEGILFGIEDVLSDLTWMDNDDFWKMLRFMIKSFGGVCARAIGYEAAA